MKSRYKISYSPLFFQDLDKIILYIKNDLDNEVAANELVDEIEKSILSRVDFPTAYEPYRASKERKKVYYRIYVRNYVIFYVVRENIMEIRRILYSKRDIRKFL